MQTERQLARAARLVAIDTVVEKAARDPERVANVLTANPDLFLGVRPGNVEEILAALYRAGQTQALEAIGASRRCPPAVRRIVLKILVG